ncbi:VOC family protein [Mariniluteicoccus flavus]
MDITIHQTFLPHTDPEQSLAFYRDVLGFEVRLDVGQGTWRWITVGPPNQPGTAIVLQPPTAAPGLSDAEKTMITELVAKGSLFAVNLVPHALDATFATLVERGAEVVQEPTDQPYGIRDCAFRDPAGNLVRMQELKD